jgi:hypothetical protein
MAFVRPMRSASCMTPPCSVMMPTRASGNAKRAELAATMKSQLSASSKPPPMQPPWTAATDGIFNASSRSRALANTSILGRNSCAGIPGHSRTSPPRQKSAPSARTSTAFRTIVDALESFEKLSPHGEVDPVAARVVECDACDVADEVQMGVFHCRSSSC